MRRNRLIYLAAWILSLVGISFFGGVVSYGLFWTLTLLPVVMLIYLLFVLFGFKIYQQLNIKEVVSRAPVSYYFTLQNESVFPFAHIRVSFFEFGVDYADLNRDEEYELLPHSGHKLTTGIICKYRGEYDIGVRKIIITDFLRLFKLTYKNPETLKVNVLPAIIYPSGDLQEIQSLFSNISTPVSPDMKDLLVRDYIEGDPLRSINWKATAKRQKIMVSNMISEEHHHIHILLDTRRYSSNYEVYLPLEDEILTRLITTVLFFIQQHIMVDVYYDSQGPVHISLSSMNEFGYFYAAVSSIVFDSDHDINTLRLELLEKGTVTPEDMIVLESGLGETEVGDE